MRYNFYFSPLAEKKLLLLFNYLIDEWSVKVKDNFRLQLDEKLYQVSEFPESCIKSKHFYNLHLCIVTKQTSFLYRIKNNEIEVVTVFDNRSSFKSITKEIRKYYGRI
ncbi:type II toxin-antitoxin system RelE/ParE family toxin [Flavobacterium sp. Sd200]|uniref:type II toxin-antitoxin system RelE/ParE family toxin n=1 Tax=Flavobacterium sp. Sd200 TaxID=2692211 RepID=UPI00136F421C|nr:type II toxin-antitoxin system RelE/ParE family toxin [Flavobacterium sp. Sd200]MXN90858.1 type II toxin-antitoxin system RelE/ParE family toxin [Flavobacterium sp. Sd200]